MSEELVRKRETEKYVAMWGIHEYRRHSPGVRELPDFREHCGPFHGRSIIDFGCGTGRAALQLQEVDGAIVTGLDLVREALDPTPKERLRFVEACIWSLPPQLEAEIGYCTDVMEHIPPEYVRLSFMNIFRTVTTCFFQIACFHDGFGRRINATLHETVMPPEKWIALAKDIWPQVQVIGVDDKKRVQLICTR